MGKRLAAIATLSGLALHLASPVPAAPAAATARPAPVTSAHDPRLTSFMARAAQRAHETQALCSADLERAGLPVLNSAVLSDDPDFSREITSLKAALVVVQTNCVAYNKQALDAGLADLHRLKLRPSDDTLAAVNFKAGLQKGADEAKGRLVRYLEDSLVFLQFLHDHGAKWQGSQQGFVYRTDAEAAQGNQLAARAAQSRDALLSGQSATAAAIKQIEPGSRP